MQIIFNPDSFPANARSAQYGDGCFTTAKIASGKVQLMALHLQRLRNDCQRLAINLSKTEFCKIEHAMVETAATQSDGVLKVIVSAGVGGRGYNRDADSKPVVYLSVFPEVLHYDKWRREGIKLGISKVKLNKNELLAGIKHLNRLEQVLVKSSFDSLVEDEVVLDQDNMMVEVSAGNLFWSNGKAWFTPELIYSGVFGVMRNHIIAKLESQGQRVVLLRASVDMLNNASDVFICNSLMGVVAVNEILLPNASKPIVIANNGLLPQLKESLVIGEQD